MKNNEREEEERERDKVSYILTVIFIGAYSRVLSGSNL